MSYPGNLQPAWVVLSAEALPGQSAPSGAGHASGGLSGAAPVLDPFRVASEEPVRWAAYINAYFPQSDAQVMAAFGVCEKTARLWRQADRAPRSHQRTLAERMHGRALMGFMHGGRVADGRYYPE